MNKIGADVTAMTMYQNIICVLSSSNQFVNRCKIFIPVSSLNLRSLLLSPPPSYNPILLITHKILNHITPACRCCSVHGCWCYNLVYFFRSPKNKKPPPQLVGATSTCANGLECFTLSRCSFQSSTKWSRKLAKLTVRSAPRTACALPGVLRLTLLGPTASGFSLSWKW
jgi:hypothetical protein